MSRELDPMDEFRHYIVICGKSHISINEMYKFTLQEAETVRSNMENQIREKLEATPEKDFKTVQYLEWRLATLRIEEIVLN
jgi:ferritin